MLEVEKWSGLLVKQAIVGLFSHYQELTLIDQLICWQTPE